MEQRRDQTSLGFSKQAGMLISSDAQRPEDKRCQTQGLLPARAHSVPDGAAPGHSEVSNATSHSVQTSWELPTLCLETMQTARPPGEALQVPSPCHWPPPGHMWGHTLLFLRTPGSNTGAAKSITGVRPNLNFRSTGNFFSTSKTSVGLLIGH